MDKVSPSILVPAGDKTVECDGRGNTAELSSWLAAKCGALALDNCCAVTWAHDYGLTVICGYSQRFTGGQGGLKWGKGGEDERKGAPVGGGMSRFPNPLGFSGARAVD